MTISKKGSRKITVNLEAFRWVISPSSKGIIILTVQHEEVSGQIIRVYIESDINDFWFEFPHVESLNNKVITPVEVSTIIAEAIVKGWDPRKRGTPLSFNLCRSTLIKRGT
jgi:hypothetical protein